MQANLGGDVIRTFVGLIYHLVRAPFVLLWKAVLLVLGVPAGAVADGGRLGAKAARKVVEAGERVEPIPGLDACRRCGAKVNDWDAHYRWHQGR